MFVVGICAVHRRHYLAHAAGMMSTPDKLQRLIPALQFGTLNIGQ
jgi:hypothetical protein